MKTKINTLARILILLIILLSLTGGLKNSVQAATCTWLGNSTNWSSASNWSCGHVPGSGDDVIIADSSNDPIINSGLTINVNSLTINSGASLIDDSSTFQIYATSVTNNGTLKTQGMDSALIRVWSIFDNNGIINSTAGQVNLEYGGTHSGQFMGAAKILIIGSNHTFLSSSYITVRKIEFISTGELDIPGRFYQTQGGSYVSLENSHVNLSSLISPVIGEVYLYSNASITYGLSGTTSDSVAVPRYAALTGTGTIAGDLDNAGTVSPGNSPGTISVDSDFTQTSTGTLEIELGGTTAGTEYDQLLIDGLATLDGTLDVSLIDDFTPSLFNQFSILNFGTISGSFSTVNLPELPTGYRWDLSTYYTEMVLTVEASVWDVSGTVTYIGDESYNPIIVSVYQNPGWSPLKSVEVSGPTGTYDYTIPTVYDGTWYISALMDLNDNGEPDPDEPFAWYGDQVIIDGADVENIDFTLDDPGYEIFLPIILR